MNTKAVGTISVHDLKHILAEGDALVIDVRTPAEYAEGHIPGARSFPLDALDATAVDGARRETASSKVYVVCRAGARSQQAIASLSGQGLTGLVNVEGGTMAWMAARFLVEVD